MEDLNDWLPITEQICIHGRYSDDGSSVKFLQYLDSILTIENNQVFAPLIAYSHYRNDRITWLLELCGSKNFISVPVSVFWW